MASTKTATYYHVSPKRKSLLDGLSGSDEKLFGPYAKQHFKTIGQEHKSWQNVAKLLEPITNTMKKDSISFGELRDRINEHHPEDKVIKVMQEANDFNDKDLIFSFNKNYFDDDELFWDEEE